MLLIVIPSEGDELIRFPVCACKEGIGHVGLKYSPEVSGRLRETLESPVGPPQNEPFLTGDGFMGKASACSWKMVSWEKERGRPAHGLSRACFYFGTRLSEGCSHTAAKCAPELASPYRGGREQKALCSRPALRR